MKPAETLKVNEPNVVHETIDGETILLDLNTGNYFSLDGSGAIIWEFIHKTGKWNDAIRLMAGANEPQKDNISEAISRFVEELVTENLLVEALNTKVDEDFSTLENQLKEAALNFSPPLVNKYSDMQDLLLLDPIHEVDERGWPESKEIQEDE